MRQVLTLFVSTFSTLLAIINPLEALPIFLNLSEGEGVSCPLPPFSRTPRHSITTGSSSGANAGPGREVNLGPVSPREGNRVPKVICRV